MQRYFLIFSIIFLSYLLLINYSPPQEEFTRELGINDSEYSQLVEEEAFVSRSDIIDEEVFLFEETCSTNNLFLISNDVGKLKLNYLQAKYLILHLQIIQKLLAQVTINCS